MPTFKRWRATSCRIICEGLPLHNVRDGAALVVDNATGDVLAYVGSAGPASRARHVDGVRAHRQAGSTLKPFLYQTRTRTALSDERIAARRFTDQPRYRDRRVSAAELRSRLQRTRQRAHSARQFAERTGRARARARRRRGIPRSIERTRLRRHQRRRRVLRLFARARFRRSQPVGTGRRRIERSRAAGSQPRCACAPTTLLRRRSRMLAADATFLVTDILGDRAARVATFGLDNNLNTAFWSAAKTGTSKDMRDNWCIGFTRPLHGRRLGRQFRRRLDARRQRRDRRGTGVARHHAGAARTGARRNAPAPPAGVTQVPIAFEPPVEPPRREWFVAGTELTIVATVPERAERSRIAAPGNGLIIAIDPGHTGRSPARADARARRNGAVGVPNRRRHARRRRFAVAVVAAHRRASPRAGGRVRRRRRSGAVHRSLVVAPHHYNGRFVEHESHLHAEEPRTPDRIARSRSRST